MTTVSLGVIVLAAFVMDLFLGDPRWLPHPVRWMGYAIQKLEPVFRRIPWQILSGAAFAAVLIFGTWALSLLVLTLVNGIHPWAGLCLQGILLFYCISADSLAAEASKIGRFLIAGQLPESKAALRFIVGRDVKDLDEAGVARATVETVAENLVDGFIAPLFFAVIGGPSLAMAYKMVNTLDSMIGYKNEKYCLFGKTAARIDDVANFIPARISVFLISAAVAILSNLKDGRRALLTGLRDGNRHSSPNAGFPEAAFSGALMIKLGGPNTYGGQYVEKPYIGVQFGPVEVSHITQARDLMLMASVLWVVIIFIGFTIFC